MMTITGSLGMDGDVVALSTHTTCYCTSVSTPTTPLSATIVVLAVVLFSTNGSCTISIGTGCEV